ncbi:MAG: hypothetical protein AAFY43_07335 [Pseudomonadota bacterium]
MTQTFSADIRKWTQKAIRNAELVVRDAAATTGELMSRRQPSIKETGTFQIGLVPVDTGELVLSQVVSINGGIVATGDPAYAAVLAGFEVGDTIEAAFTAPHAPFMEYGFTADNGTLVSGRFFVREAVQQWSATVAATAAKFKD